MTDQAMTNPAMKNETGNETARHLTLEHSGILRRRGFLREIYRDHYRYFAAHDLPQDRGLAVELGSGPGFLQDHIPDIVRTDLFPLPGHQLALSAMDLPFPGGSLRSLFMLNVFHHVPDVDQFLGEARRCLAPGGLLAMVEPSNTPWSRFIYQRFHHEPFDPAAPEWSFPGTDPLMDANQALPWIVFVRDRSRFEAQHRGLTLEAIELCHPVRYLISGGFSSLPLLPALAYGLVDRLEGLLPESVLGHSGMFMRIRLRRTPPS